MIEKSKSEDGNGFLSMDFKSVYIQPTEGEVNHEDGIVKHPSDLDGLLGVSTTPMDFDPSSLEGEVQLKTYMKVKCKPSDVVEAAPVRVLGIRIRREGVKGKRSGLPRVMRVGNL